MKTTFLPALCSVGLLSAFAALPARADRSINFGTTLEAVNQQSNGSAFDASFNLELGTFTAGFEPTPENTSDWLFNWVAAPNASDSPFSGARTSYSTADAPLGGGPANSFQGFVFLDQNDPGFAPGTQGYFWIFDLRADAPSAEWLLITNAEWKVPTVVPGAIEFNDHSWVTEDAGTYSITGSVNPDFDPYAPVENQSPHLVSSSVVSLAAIPEPGVLFLAAPAALLIAFRRRR